MGEDGTVFQSQSERAAWAVGMERFLKDNAGSPYKADALKRYHAIMHLLLYSDVPPRRQDGSMDNWSWWRDEMMKDIVWRYRGTLTGTLTEDFIAGVDASGGKEPKDLEKHQSARIDSTFAQGGTAPQKSRNAAALQYQGEGAINGTIPVSLWFESRDGIISGEIVYTRTKDRTPIRILGRVQDNGLLRLREMLPDGRVSGTITGSPEHGRAARRSSKKTEAAPSSERAKRTPLKSAGAPEHMRPSSGRPIQIRPPVSTPTASEINATTARFF